MGYVMLENIKVNFIMYAGSSGNFIYAVAITINLFICSHCYVLRDANLIIQIVCDDSRYGGVVIQSCVFHCE